MSGQTLQSTLSLRQVLEIILVLFGSFILAQTLAQMVYNDIAGKLLLKYYSPEEIKNRNLEISHKYKYTRVSDGTELPLFDHDNFSKEQRARTFFINAIPFIALIYVAYRMQYFIRLNKKKRN